MFPIDSLWENLIFNNCMVFHHLDLPEYDYLTNDEHVGGFLVIATEINTVLMVP